MWFQPRHGGADWISFSPDNKLAAVSFMSSLVLMDPTTGDHRGGFSRLGSAQKSSFSPDGRQLAVLADGVVKVFDVEAVLAGWAGRGASIQRN